MVKPMRFFIVLILSAAFVGRLQAELLLHLSDSEYAYVMTDIDGKLWFGLESGAFVVNGEGEPPVQILAGQTVNAITGAHENTWIGCDRGLFLVRRDSVVPILQDQLAGVKVTALYLSRSILWIGSTRGLFRWEPESEVEVLHVLTEPVRVIEEIDGAVWVGTSRNAYKIDYAGTPQGISADPIDVAAIYSASGSVWLATIRSFGRMGYGSPLRIDDGKPEEILSGQEVTSVAGVDRETWFGTSSGLLRDREGQLELSIDEPVNSITSIRGDAWLATTRRAYRRVGKEWVPYPRPPIRLNVKEVIEYQGNVWLRTESGIFLLYLDANVTIDLSTKSLFGFDFLTGPLDS